MASIEYSVLKKIPLLKGMDKKECEQMCSDLKYKIKSFKKGEIIFHEGDRIKSMGIVLEGMVHMENSDLWGNKNLIGTAKPFDVFAETYSYIGDAPLMVSVIADRNSRILFLDMSKVKDNKNAKWHSKFTDNILKISMKKNLALSQKMMFTTPKGIRNRVLVYLTTQSINVKKNEFDIPFDRQQMADYLGVERSALSKELGRMKDEGLIDFKKNHFIINTQKEDQDE